MSWSQGNFAGYLGADPEMKQLGDSQICKFRIGAKTGYGSREATLWVTCVAWGKQAENINKFFTKGSFIIVSGELRPNEWEGKDGAQNKSFELNVQNFAFGNKAQGDAAPSRPAPAASAPARTEGEDDLPF